MSFAAILIAIAAFLTTIWQLVTRHRPFVAVETIDVQLSDYGQYTMAVNLKNWGETLAYGVEAGVIFMNQSSEGDSASTALLQGGAHTLAPDQPGKWIFPAPESAAADWTRFRDVTVVTRIYYRSPGAFKIKWVRIKYGYHTFSETYRVGRKSSGIEFGVE